MKYRYFIFLLFLFPVITYTQVHLPVAVDRPMAAAGGFYPADPDELNKTLDKLFFSVKKATVKDVAAVIVPHAGYPFSGAVAANSIQQIDPDKEFDNIFIIGSSHYIDFDGASIYSAGDYLTPLGKVPVNRELAAKIIHDNPVFSFNPEADNKEHCIEVEVPFLQYHLKKPFRIIPVVIGTSSAETCKKIANALLPYFNEKNLFIISTDFSHYPSQQDAKIVDKNSEEAIVSNSPAELLQTITSNASKKVPALLTSMCGWTSVLTMLYMTSPDPSIKIVPLLYRNSGDVANGDKSRVVGYWSIAVTRTGTNKDDKTWLNIDDKDKREMLKISRSALNRFISEGRQPVDQPVPAGNIMNRKYGVFVTLTENGELRGCIGRMLPDKPLFQLIPEMTVAAASQDPRFKPVRRGEEKEIRIGISVLSPLKKIRSPDEIIIGRHGILIRKGDKEGTLLPQVGKGMTTEQFLGLCSSEKAGLGWDGWKTAEIFIYEAVDFSESQFTANKD